MIRISTFLPLLLLILANQARANEQPSNQNDSNRSPVIEEKKPTPAKKTNWRHDSTLKRRPGSYIGGGIGYAQAHAWLKANDDHDKLYYGPLNTFGTSFRVGDAFTDWFTLGFQIQTINAKKDSVQFSAFDLMLDTTFYPYKGLGIRPAVGIGLGFVKGKKKWEFGGGGPACISMSFLYEFRITRLFSIAPIAQATWISGGEFDFFFFTVGIEFTKWFLTATG